MAAKMIKMCNMTGDVASEVFVMLNPGKVEIRETNDYRRHVLVTDVEPKDLVYPEGWYYAKGSFRNKHQSTTGFYSEVYMFRSNGQMWNANYCTLD